MNVNCDFHPNIESTFQCDYCKKNLCLADKKTVLNEIEISSGDDTTTYTDVLTLCYECEVEKRINDFRKENESWLKTIFQFFILIPFEILLIGVGAVGIFFLFSLLLDPVQMYNEYGNAIFGIPILTIFFGVFGIGGLILVYAEIYAVRKKLTTSPEIKLEELVHEQEQIKLKFSEPDYDLSQQNFVCSFHPSREAVESCYKCQRLVCREDKYTDKTNRSVPIAIRASEDLRQAILCPICFYDTEITKIKKRTWISFTIWTVLSIPFIWAGILLFNIGLQINDYLLMASIAYSLASLTILSYMAIQRFKEPKLVNELEAKKNLFLQSINEIKLAKLENKQSSLLQSTHEIQLSDLEPINKNIKKEPPYCYQCGDITTFGTRFEISKDQFICTSCYYENHGKYKKFRLSIKGLVIGIVLSPLIILFSFMFSALVALLFFLPYLIFLGHILYFKTFSPIGPLSIRDYFAITIMGILSLVLLSLYMGTKSVLPKQTLSKSEWLLKKETFERNKSELMKSHPSCKYHPKVEATTRCEKCASFICDKDTKIFYKRTYSTTTDEEVQSNKTKRENEFITTHKGPKLCPSCYLDLRILDYTNSGKITLMTIYYYSYFLLFSLALITEFLTYGIYTNVILLIIIGWGFKNSIAGKIKMRPYKKVRIKQLEAEKRQFLMETGYYPGD